MAHQRGQGQKQTDIIPFKADFSEKMQDRKLRYHLDEFSLDMSPHSDCISTTLSLNFLSFGVLDDVVLQVSGYFPSSNWIRTSLSPPNALEGALILDIELDFPGSTRLNDIEVQVHHNPDTRWTCLGDPQAKGESVEFIRDCIAVIDSNQALASLWIKLDKSPMRETEVTSTILAFHDLAWHDANLLKIEIPRQHEDIVRVLIEWPEYEKSGHSWIEFFDCYGFKANMHFGFAPPEPILQARCVNQSLEIDELRSVWNKVEANLGDLLQFEIHTNTSNSLLKIFAKGFRILEGE